MSKLERLDRWLRIAVQHIACLFGYHVFAHYRRTSPHRTEATCEWCSAKDVYYKGKRI